MDLSRPIFYRSANINSLETLQPEAPMSGYIVNSAQFLEVEGVGYKEKRSQGDGYDSSRVYMGMQRLLLRGTIYALGKYEYHDRIRFIRALFNPRLAYLSDPSVLGYVPLTFDILTEDDETWADGIIPVQLGVRPADMPGSIFLREHAFGNANKGYSQPYEVMLEAIDPLIYAQSTTDITTTTASGSGSIDNDGNYPSPLQLTLFLPAANAGQRKLHLTGFGTVMTVTIPASGDDRTVRVDSKNKVVTLTDNGIETIAFGLVEFSAGYTWPEVSPGANSYSWTTTGGAPGTGSKMWFREAFA